jgi:hypothetical protein
MTFTFTKTESDLQIDIAKCDQSISHTKVILSQVSINDCSLMFFTRDKFGQQTYHCLRQDHFEFPLSYEITKLLIENLEQLEEKKAELLNHYSQIIKNKK